MKKVKNKIRYTFAAMLIACAAAVVICTAMPIKAAAAESATYTQNFASAAAVNEDFEAYYQLTMGSRSQRTAVDANAAEGTNWYVEGGELIRQIVDNDISSDMGTDSFAILTFTKKQYVNFELTVDYRMGAETYWWPVVAFRQSEAGRYFLETGGGVFVQQEGMVTLWGSDVDSIGGPYEGMGVSGYNRSNWHTMRIRLDGLDLTVWLDGSSTPALTRKLNSSAFKSGYVSLISVNNDSRFRNFSITELAVNRLDGQGSQKPVASADTDDSLDKLAQKVDKIDELDGHKQTDSTVKNPNGQEKEKSGCGSNMAATCGFGALLPFAAVTVAVIRRKRKRA